MSKKIEKGNVRDIFELSNVQQGMLFHCLRAAGHNLYCVQVSLAIEGGCDPVLLERAFRDVQGVNDILRSVFRWEGLDRPLQIVLEKCPLDFTYLDEAPADAGGKGVGDEEERIRDFVINEWKAGFDLEELPMRVCLIRQSNGLYILTITHHHILYDGWSNALLLKEVFARYQELLKGGQAPLIPKAAYKPIYLALKERAGVQGWAEYWKGYLDGCDATCLVPAARLAEGEDRPVDKQWFKAAMPGLEAFAAANKVTAAAVLYAAHALLLQRSLGRKDIVFGTTVSGRSGLVPGIGNCIGNFINTIPLRCGNVEESTLLELVRSVHEQLIERDQYSGTSYWDIRQLLQLSPGVDLYDSVVAIENYPVDAGMIHGQGGMKVSLREVYEHTSIPLVFTVFFREQLEVEIMYKEDQLNGADVALLGNGLINIIKEICADGNRKVGELPAMPRLSGVEGLRGLKDLVDADGLTGAGLTGLKDVEALTRAVDQDRERTVLDRFLEQVREAPERIALETRQGSMSYRELDESSSRMAAYLEQVGVEAGELVGLMLEREAWLVVSIFGILKAGAAYVPIDAAYPAGRVQAIAAKAGWKAVITREKYRELFAGTGGQMIDLDRDMDRILGSGWNGNTGRKAGAGDLAYVLFTSGSTGEPKGVMIEHGSLFNYINWACGQYVREERGNFALFTSISFDLTVTSVFTPLVTGNKLIIYPEGEAGSMIGEMIMNPELDIIKLTPSHLKIIRDVVDPGAGALSRKKFIVGGEDLPAMAARGVDELFGGAVEIYNEYGPTEATVGCMIYRYDPAEAGVSVPIGHAISGASIYILDEQGRPAAAGEEGELFISGVCVARGYLYNEVMTAQRFIDDPFAGAGARMYKSGDIAVSDGQGKIWYKGRIDDQVKIRGFRIELEEIASRLKAHEQVRDAAVLVKEEGEDKYLVACYVPRGMTDAGVVALDAADLKRHLSEGLPAYMVPAHFVPVAGLPLTVNGKLDKKYLLGLFEERFGRGGLAATAAVGVAGDVGREKTASGVTASGVTASGLTETETKLRKIWAEVLKHDGFGLHQNFFDAGGDSLKVISLGGKINRAFKIKVAINDLFKYPTVASFAEFIHPQAAPRVGDVKANVTTDVREEERVKGLAAGKANGEAEVKAEGKAEVKVEGKAEGLIVGMDASEGLPVNAIAVIGMAGRFPGAQDIAQFWENLWAGRESITRKDVRGGSDALVYAKGMLEDYEWFDAAFFDYIPSEAESMDPQMRIFHECVWQALEHAGYDPGSYRGAIGLYGGASPNPFYNLDVRLQGEEDFFEKWSSLTYADKDFLCPRVSYKLNLKGPSVNISTACSTSLVAVDAACGELLAGKCDMALAGGVSVTQHDNEGYRYHKGMILSPDGRCRAFDKDSAGTVGGNGVGVVVLKRLQDALRDGDTIHAVIRGTATNNDGNQKVGFTAPGIEGQSAVIRMAMQQAGVGAESLSYVEAHGTGTALGDPIEVAALTKAFASDKKQYCAIGSVKSNIGHLDAAAGIAALIKTVLALGNRQLPPSLHYKVANPNIPFGDSPFYVNAAPVEWEVGKGVRRAGVSSFGIGGTNAHVILEEAAGQPVLPAQRDRYLFLLSAKTPVSLAGNIAALRAHLVAHPEQGLADLAYTLQVGRAGFGHRKMIVCGDREEAIARLAEAEGQEAGRVAGERKPAVVFLFSGQGSQYVHMYADLYAKEPVFRETVEECFALVRRISGKDLRPIVFPDRVASGAGSTTGERGEGDLLNNTVYTQPALFVMEYAMARLLMGWGIGPTMMIGHSIGEYVAACISGVMSLEDGLALVVRRGELMQEAPAGVMLSVSITEENLLPLLEGHPGIALAAVNSSELCVVAGEAGAMQGFKATLDGKGYGHKQVPTSHAFHSQMMDGILPAFAEAVAKVRLRAPGIPFVSNLTGEIATGPLVSSPSYWVDHLRHQVKFAAGAGTILRQYEQAVLVELGPGQALATAVRTNRDRKKEHRVLSLVRRQVEKVDDFQRLLSGLGEMWVSGVGIDWKTYYSGERRRRVPLPGYVFDRKKFPAKRGLADVGVAKRESVAVAVQEAALGKWFSVPSWELAPVAKRGRGGKERMRNLLVTADGQFGHSLKEQLTAAGELVEEIKTADDGFVGLLAGIGSAEMTRVILAWGDAPGIGTGNEYALNEGEVGKRIAQYHALLELARAIGKAGAGVGAGVEIVVITNGAYVVMQGDVVLPASRLVSGALRVIPKEFNRIKCRQIDILVGEAGAAMYEWLAGEISSGRQDEVVAYRGRTRFTPVLKPVSLVEDQGAAAPFVAGGLYLVTGGTGGMGLGLMKRIAERTPGVVFLVMGRREQPDCGLWKEVEAAGAQLHYYPVDIKNKEAVKAVVEEACGRFGKLRGVIHAAGVADHGGLIFQRKAVDDEVVFAAKVWGTIAVLEAVAVQRPDFIVVCSSLASVGAHAGQVGYVAANMFLDALADHAGVVGDVPVISIAWNAWREGGMAVAAAERMGNSDHLLDGVDAAEGYEILVRAIQSGLSGVAVSRMRNWDGKVLILADVGGRDLAVEQAGGTGPGAGQGSRGIAGAGGLEERMLGLWRDFFSEPGIGKDDDFFEIGGDSLKALRMINRMHKAFGVEVALTDFFSRPSVRGLSAYIGSLQHDVRGEDKDAVGYRSVPVAEKRWYYPLSSGQKGLYFLYAYNKTSIAYNMPLTLLLKGKLDARRVELAFRKLIARHESLRTYFELVEGLPFQRIADEFHFELEKHIARGNEAEIIASFIRPFDLHVAPLIRAGLVTITPEEHILMVDLHHIITDGTSKSLLIKDFIALYDNVALAPLPLQYKDYSVWQQHGEWKAMIGKQRAYWLGEFGEAAPVLDLPTDFQRPAAKSYKGDAMSFVIGREEVEGLKRLAEAEGATLFMVVLTIYNVLLARCGGQEDIVVGVPVAGRQHSDLHAMIGLFVNILPFRNYPAREKTFRECLREVRMRALACFEHQAYPYEELVNELKVERDPQRNPLFDTVLFYQNYQQVGVELPGLQIDAYPDHYSAIDYDINLVVFEREDRLDLQLEYATDLFRRERIAGMVKLFGHLVRIVLLDADLRVGGPEMLEAGEREALRRGINGEIRPLDKNKLFPALFREQVYRTPERIAVRHLGKELSYAGLWAKTEGWAAGLAARGVGRGKRVALYLPRGIDMLCAIIACFKRGAAYLPLELAHPAERTRDILANSLPELVLTEAPYAELIETIRLGVPGMGELVDVRELEGGEALYPGVENEADDLAYIIYTSGTTGRPKGVMIHQLGMLNHLQAKIHDLALGSADVVAQTASPCFDISVWQFLAALLTGGTTCIIDKDKLLHPQALFRALQEERITIFESVPSLLTAFMDGLPKGRREELPDLRWMIPTGEPLGQGLVRKWYAYFPETKMLNAYGPTEASDDITHYVVPGPGGELEGIPIGRPVQNTRIYILDRLLQPCAAGVKGEICVAGPCVGKGYWQDEERTKKVFLENPLVDAAVEPAYSILYRTGDTGYWLEDGTIMCLGRIDEQVKIRGNRVELGEIESTLLTYEPIREAAVILWKGSGQGNGQLAAYYVGEAGVDHDHLKDWLSARLPDYMVPASFMKLERMPLTGNGKLDKKALPAPVMVSDREYIAPRTPEERLLAGIWSGVLGVEHPGVSDNLFAVGGDSIKSIQIGSRLRQEGYEVTVKEIFMHPTIAQLARVMRKCAGQADQSLIMGRSALTPIQRMYWEGSGRDRHHYNQSVLLHFRNGITGEVVNKLFGQLLLHHDALRMVFPEPDGLFQENLGDGVSLSMEEHDLRGQEDEEALWLSLASGLQAGMDLSEGPLMRVGLYYLQGGSRVLIAVHHLVMDGISWRILFEDIGILYDQLLAGKPMKLPLKTASFLSWAGQLQEYMGGKAYKDARTYWESMSKRKTARLKRDIPEGGKLVGDNAELRFSLDREATKKLLTEVHFAFGTKMNDVLLAALLVSMNRLSGIRSLKVDVEGHGREAVGEGLDISRTIGWFTSVYPVYLEYGVDEAVDGGGTDAGAVLRSVKEGLRRIPNNGIDYLLYRYMDERGRGMGNAMEEEAFVIFNYLGQFDADIAGQVYEVLEQDRGAEVSVRRERRHDWEIWAMVKDGELVVSVTYSKAQYFGETMGRFIRMYKESLGELIGYCCEKKRVLLTPSDLSYTGLPMAELDRLQQVYDIEDIYPLSPLQEGMLFHSLLEPRSGNYFEQMTYRMTGDLDRACVEQSLNDLAVRYAVLRTIFLNNGYERPLQLVLKERKVEFHYRDISEACLVQGKEEVFERYRLEDRERDFELGVDDLIRVSMLRTGRDEYMFIWSHHHILMDGWCVGIIIKEFRNIYYNNKRGLAQDLPPVNPYSGYIKWLEGRDRAAGDAYWKGYLHGYASLASLPKRDLRLLAPAPAEKEVFELVIGREKTRSLRAVSGACGVTMNTIIQTAWGILLSGYNRCRDVVFGSVVSGRPAEVPGIEQMVGLFINTIPVRVQYTEGDSVGQLLRDVQRRALETDAYQYHSLADIQSLSVLGNGLLDHLLIFLNYPVAVEIEKGQAAASGEGDHRTDGDGVGAEGDVDGVHGYGDFSISRVRMYEQTNYDLLLIVIPGEEIRIKFEYNARAFQSETIRGIAGCLEQLVDQFGTACDETVVSLELLPAKQREELVEGYNDTKVVYAGGDSVIDLFEDQVARAPERIALRCDGRSMSYLALKEHVDGIASYLHGEAGVSVGDLVGIMLDRDEYLVPWILGVLRAGAAYVPIDPQYPEERVKAIVEGAGMKLLVTRERYRSMVAGMGVPVLDIRSAMTVLEELPVRLPGRPRGGDLAYIIFTSGSTGLPKGVMIEHGSLKNYCCWAGENYIKDFAASVALFTSISFDLTITSIFPPLITGNEIVVYGEEQHGLLIERIIAGGETNVFKLTPSHLRIIRDCEGPVSIGGDGRVKFIVGGEDLETELARAIYDKYGGNVDIYNEYGPTEATVGCMIHRFDPAAGGGSVPIGVPAANTQIYLLDAYGKPVPAGVDGEMFIGGEGLARGYLRQDALTGEKFVDNPFIPGSRMYRTGDMASWLADGTMVYKGRADEQVKIRGFRIEPGEIEVRLLRLFGQEGLREVRVIARGKGEDKVLAAYYTGEGALDVRAMRNLLAGELPAYMIPEYFVFLEEFPLSPNGKLDRNALPEPGIGLVSDYRGPENETEEKLAGLWARILNTDMDRISSNMTFFELGGNSLKLMRLNSLMNQTFQKAVSVPDMFRYPTISLMAGFIRQGAGSGVQGEGVEHQAEHEVEEMQDVLSRLALD